MKMAGGTSPHFLPMRVAISVSPGYSKAKEALRWARPAAEQGEATAQVMLGLMYDLGQAVPQDYIQAHMWYNLAASSLTGENREQAARNRDRLAIVMTPEDIAEAQRLAREWKPKGLGSL